MDIDGDGRRDILSGSYSRMTNDMAGLFQVLYGKTDGTFRKAEVLKGTDGEPLIIPVRSKPGKGDDWSNNICTRPFAVDWDGDGHLDLVVGTFPGKFYLFKGQGSGKFLPKPDEMKAGDQPLKVKGVDDVNGDGKLDILVGDMAPLLSPAAGLSEAEFKKRSDEWTKELGQTAEKMHAAKDEKERTKAQQRIQELYQQRTRFMKDERTGFVWLYLRK